MGGGSSKPMTPAERAAARARRELAREKRRKKKQDKQAKKDAIERERNAWLRNYRGKLKRKWWHAGWWPIYEVWTTRFLECFVAPLKYSFLV